MDEDNKKRPNQRERDEEQAVSDRKDACADEASTPEEAEIRKRLEDLGYL